METNQKSLLLKLNVGSLSEIFTFMSMAQLLKIRLVCKKFNKSVWYGWKLRIYEIEIIIKDHQKLLGSGFDLETLEAHHDTLDRKSRIEQDLDNCLQSARTKGRLFRKVQDIGYLVNPSRLIVLPILTSMILMGLKFTIPKGFDFTDKAKLKEIWHPLK